TRAGGTPFLHDLHDLRDHVASPADDDRVADADVLTVQLVHVVQSCIADSDAPDEDGLQARDRRQRPGSSDLKLHAPNHRELFLRGELVRERLSRRARYVTQTFLPIEAVYLVDHPVYLIG